MKNELKNLMTRKRIEYISLLTQSIMTSGKTTGDIYKMIKTLNRLKDRLKILEQEIITEKKIKSNRKSK